MTFTDAQQLFRSVAQRMVKTAIVQPLVSQMGMVSLQYHGDVLPVIKQLKWSTIMSNRWKFQDHINVLELQAALLSIRWYCSLLESSHAKKLVLVMDNATSVHCMRKGRSSSATLLPVLRKLAALSLVSGLTVLPLFVPSAYNPADEPSRHC